MLKMQSVIASVAFVLFQLIIKEQPETPPSAVALAPVQINNPLVAFREMSGNKSLLLLMVTFALMIGLQFSLGNVISILFSPFGFQPSDTATLGLIMLICGIVGSAVSGVILDRTAAYKRIIQLAIVFSALSLGLTCFFLFTEGVAAKMFIYLTMVPFGFSIISIMPAGLGLGVELTFPSY